MHNTWGDLKAEFREWDDIPSDQHLELTCATRYGARQETTEGDAPTEPIVLSGVPSTVTGRVADAGKLEQFDDWDEFTMGGPLEPPPKLCKTRAGAIVRANAKPAPKGGHGSRGRRGRGRGTGG